MTSFLTQRIASHALFSVPIERSSSSSSEPSGSVGPKDAIETFARPNRANRRSPAKKASTLSFGLLGRRAISADFDGGSISSDGGVLLLGQVDAQYGLSAQIAAVARTIGMRPMWSIR